MPTTLDGKKMNRWMIVVAVVLVSACTNRLPAPAASNSVVMLSSDATYTLVASKLNGAAVEHGRYFSVAPGPNRLEVLVVGDSGKNDTLNKFVLIDYHRFAKARSYQLSLVDRGVTKALQLSDEHGVLLAERAF